jgi:hypothetical protein
MRIAPSRRRSSVPPDRVRAFRGAAAGIARRLFRTMHATRAGAQGTTSALQTLPDSTLMGLAATSVGVGTGFYLARAPRLAIAAGVVPALVMGAAILLRPIRPGVIPDVTASDHVD